MSTSSGVTSKGEKGKQKYQSLDIVSLIRVSRGEPSEKQQHRSTHQLKHGMQSLGKVPITRRPPANLPSLKSEHSGSDSAVSLVPSGGPGWAKQDTTSTTTTPSTTTTTVATNSNVTSPSTGNTQQPLSAHQAAIALPVQNTIPPANKHNTVATPATGDKSWSSVMSGSDGHPPPYQSPQFQHEFPSLSAGDGGSLRTGGDTQYGPGPSLRPQTEGSWMQGGSRAGSEPQHRSSSAPLGAPPQLSVPVGLTPQPMQPPQFRGFLQQFMYRGGNFPPNGHGAPPVSSNMPPPTSTSGSSTNNGRGSRTESRSSRATDDEVAHRPIIKEEDLSRMDDMTRDMGWASHDDIDYNQKLAFSDDESPPDKERRKETKPATRELEKTDSQHSYQDNDVKTWGSRPGPAAPTRRSTEDDELNARRRQQRAEVNSAVERAKQRKEEEEKKYLEVKQNAAKKLQELEERKHKSKRDDPDDSQGTINPSVVPPQPITPAPIPVPDWERDKDRSRNSNSDYEDKPAPPVKQQTHRDTSYDFKQMTQIEGKNFSRKEGRNFDRERDRNAREQNGPNYSKQYPNEVPPRFQRQFRNNMSSSPQPQGQGSFSNQYDPRWMQNNQSSNKNSPPQVGRKREEDLSHDREDDRRDFRRQGSDDSYRSSNRGYASESGRKSADNRCKEDDYNEDKYDKNKDYDNLNRQSSEEWYPERKYVRDRRDEKPLDRYERPQRPDSRDSRTSRESRHSRESARDSEPREYIGSWADTPYEPTYEEKKKEMAHFKEDRRQVPGPITKERIEQDDLKSEKRNLTQLKRGQIPEKKIDVKEEGKLTDKEVEDAWSLRKKDIESSKSWAEAPLQNISMENVSDNKYSYSESPKDQKIEEESRKSDSGKSCFDVGKDKDDKGRHINRGRQGWGAGSSSKTVRNSWSNNAGKKNWLNRPSRSGGPPRPSSAKSGEFHGTDSEISADEMSISTESSKDDRNRLSQRSPKPTKKFEKDEKNKETKQDKPAQDKSDMKQEKSDLSNKKDYVARGEPSRHGRGGSSFRGGRGGLSKRIDGYGPPPSKSPFSHHDEKEKKGDEADVTSSDEKSKQSLGTNKKDMSSQSSQMKKNDDKFDRNKPRRGPDNRRGKSRNKDDALDTASDNSEDSKDGKSKKHGSSLNKPGSSRAASNAPRRNNPPPRLANDKRGYGPPRTDSHNQNMRQNSSGNLRTNMKDINKDEKDMNYISNAIADISLKNQTSSEHENEIADGDVGDTDKNSLHGDSDGFQEVKSKKTGKERKVDDKPAIKPGVKLEKDLSKDRKNKSATAQLSQQQIANIPSLMATPVAPPMMSQSSSNKNQFNNNRINKLPPRFAKQRENNRLQKQHMHHNMCDVNDMNKVNQNMTMYSLKDGQNAVAVPLTNAWEKPLGVQLRGNLDQDSMLGVSIEACKGLEQAQSPNQGQASPGTDKVIGKSTPLQEKAVLDGTTPPVETIIIENTNYKSAPGSRVQRSDKPRGKMDENMENPVIGGFNKPMPDLLNKNDKQADLRIPLAFNKEDGSDIKLDFMEFEITYLSDDKASKNLGMARSMHSMTSSNSTISPSTADTLTSKLASVKKVWESMPTVLEHNVGQDDGMTFPGSFAPDPSSLDPSGAFTKGSDTPEDTNEGYSPSPNQAASNATTNVCKVKPTQQVSVSSGQTVLSAGNHQQHSAMVGGPGLMGHPLSPPPMQPVIGASAGLGQPPQQFTANQHAISYQASLSGNQYGMPAIPSPPTVLFNSTQQLQAQTGLYAPFQLDQTQVLSSQGRSQYSQYPNHYGIGQTASSPYSQSMYLQTAQPHPPPTAQAPPDLYQGMNNYRLPATGHFGQNQQLNNQSTVLISSTSNSLMSATVKPSSQQISAIGTKAGGVGQAYQQQSQQGQQLYMTYDPTMQAANYLPSTGVMQRGPGGPVQNNVVPTLQPSSSYYSGPTGGQTGYFQQPGSSTLQSGPLQQHQTGYGLQGSVFGTHNQSHTNFGSHFLSTPLQLAAAITQQYRSPNLPTTAYMKSVTNQQIGEQGGRSQQLKSPSSQQEVLSSVFNSGPQIPSPKSRQNCKQPPPQPSPTAQHKYLYPGGVGNQQSGQGRSYPPPIQRPVNYQQTLNNVQNNGSNSKHRSNNNNPNNRGAPPRQYYTSQGSGLSTQADKVDDSKLNDNTTANSTNSTNSSTANSTTKPAMGNTNITAAVTQPTEITKEKEDSSAMKD